MRLYTKLGLVLGSSLLFAVGCGVGTDGGGMTGTDGGPGTDGETPMTDGGGMGTDGGPPTGGCADEAMAFCARFEECNAQGFRAAFENQTICRRVVAAQCESPPAPIPHANGLVDEAACEAMRRGSCDGFFAVGGPPVPSACRLAPGDIVGETPNCFTDAQCGVQTAPTGREARGYCRPVSGQFGAAECPAGRCTVTFALGAGGNPMQNAALGHQLCNYFEDQLCLRAYDEDMGATGGDQCRQVDYGTAGTNCFPGTDRQCASGFACDSQAKRCMAVLAEGAACIPARDLCDTRRGLSCRNIDGAGVGATAVVYVNVGAQCGN
ncbi:MAG TPA: hypothetical protein PKB06_07375, partial [Actinotalea sp.]|nr:hypothetical protein [Actinotalea sp.]